MASMFKERSTILGLPIGREKTAWRKVGGWLAGLAILVTGLVIGRDTIKHRGNGSQSNSGSEQSGQ